MKNNMTKEDIKKAVLTGVIGGITAAVTVLVLIWAYIFLGDWYKEYKREKAQEELASTPPDNRSGDFCPECKSTDVGGFFYGYYHPGTNDSTDKAVEEGRLIPGGCMVNSNSSKYRCNSCSYEWGNYVDMIKRMKEKDEESN